MGYVIFIFGMSMLVLSIFCSIKSKKNVSTPKNDDTDNVVVDNSKDDKERANYLKTLQVCNDGLLELISFGLSKEKAELYEIAIRNSQDAKSNLEIIEKLQAEYKVLVTARKEKISLKISKLKGENAKKFAFIALENANTNAQLDELEKAFIVAKPVAKTSNEETAIGA